MSSLGGQISVVVWNVLNRPNPIDLVDIILLAILIYEAILHLQQTRASQMLKGIAILLIAQWLSGVLNMKTIHALLSWLINAGPVMLIVLFQAEIRKILEELGTTSILASTKRNQQAEIQNVIEEMVLALQHMAHRRVGALIVIERDILINDIIETGTRVDGLVSQPLIENIFEPNTPLHDGAVIVRGDRVVAAACLLRLSDTTGVGRDLGTRHRAGLGMSEVSDATVFIVSEETGVISVAEGGQLTRHLDETQMRQILHRLYDQDIDEEPLLFGFGRRRSSHDERAE